MKEMIIHNIKKKYGYFNSVLPWHANTNDIWSWYHYVDFKIKVETKRKKLTMFSEKSTSNVKIPQSSTESGQSM